MDFGVEDGVRGGIDGEGGVGFRVDRDGLGGLVVVDLHGLVVLVA